MNECWWCGREARGVCLGPHDDYNHSIAKGLKHVSTAVAEPVNPLTFKGNDGIKTTVKQRDPLLRWDPEPWEGMPQRQRVIVLV